MIEMNKIIHADCMDIMAIIPDKYFELAIVDPEYGIDVANMNMGTGKGKRCSKIENRKWSKKSWDNKTPDKSYFDELFRISQNQIIWGGNYFELPPSKSFCIWDKGEGLYGRSFSECEFAWMSTGTTRIKKINPVDKKRIHPTQKPIALYRWILQNYAKKGDKIFDSHVGSGSSIIACIEEGFEYVGCELDKDYYKSALDRIEIFKSQGKLF